MECEEEQPGGDWEVGGQLGGEFGNRGMEIEEWRDVTLWGGQALTLTFLFSTSSLPPSLPHSLSWTSCSKDKEVRTPLSVSKTPHFETHLKWLLCLWRRIMVSVSRTELYVFFTPTCTKVV